MTTTTILHDNVNFDSICRLCLSSDRKLSNIFEADPVLSSPDSTLVDKLSDCTSLQVLKDDGLPSQVCPDCSTLVEVLYNFKRRCITSDLTLRECLQKQVLHCEVKSEQDELFAEDTGKIEEQNDDDVIETGPRGRSPPPDSEWTCEAVDVEVKVEITEPPSNTNGLPPKKNIRGKAQRMTLIKDAYPCSQCPKVFAHKNSLTRHETSHTDEKFICMFCNKALSTRDTLIRHVRAHTGNKRYQCKHCGKQYTSSTSYSTHVRKHTGERPYKCHECKESFSLTSSLERHIAKHGGTKDFVCEVCDASFWVSDDLRCHVNRVH